MEFPTRINKYLAHQKLATRREADRLIEDGKVLVNDVPALLGQKIHENDNVRIVGKKRTYRYIAYYKPRGVITHSPASHETDIVSRIKIDHSLTDIFPIGRLDKDSEGLIILSDDGRITGPLLAPESNHEKEYLVTVDKNVTKQFVKNMETGVSIEGYLTKPARLLVKSKNARVFNLIITEGKKHQIRRMCAALGYQVKRLKRIRVSNIEIDTLASGEYKPLKGDELKIFLKVLGF